MKKFLLLLFLAPVITYGQWNVSAGLRLQKSFHWYWENGITAHVSSPQLLHEKLHLGINVLSSALGSALGSNAIRQEQYSVFGRYLFLKKQLHPFAQLNLGYLYAHFDQDLFSELTNTSPLVSAELGLMGTLESKWNIGASFGYNMIYGDGTTGIGTVYPLFYQFTLQYQFNRTKKDEKTDEAQ